MADGTRLALTGDSVTSKALVVLQDRPVVAFGSWLAEALRECGETGRTLQIVTPPESRISLPVRMVFAGQRAKWVVHSAPGCYDGLTGAPLHWDGEAFAPVPGATDHAPGFLLRPTSPIGTQLTLTLRIRYRENDLLAGAVERLCMALYGATPAGWGPSEPVTQPWNRGELTRYCHSRPGASWLTFVGPPSAGGEGRPVALLGTMSCTPVQGGFEESATLVLGYPATTSPPLAWLPNLAGETAGESHLMSMSAQLGPGPVDLTAEPRWAGSPAPLGLAVNAEMGGGSAVPPDIPSHQLGPIWWYDLGDGRSAEGWQRYQRLVSHLGR